MNYGTIMGNGIVQKMKRSISSKDSSSKKHVLPSSDESESNVGTDLLQSGLEYMPRETLDSYYDEETIVVESPKCKKRLKKLKCKVPVKKQKVEETSDDSSDEELSPPVKEKCKKKKQKRASPSPPAVSNAPAAVPELSMTSGASECQTVAVDLQQLVDFVK